MVEVEPVEEATEAREVERILVAEPSAARRTGSGGGGGGVVVSCSSSIVDDAGGAAARVELRLVLFQRVLIMPALTDLRNAGA